jgi:DNA-binding NarL/FixJ family response regulator
MKRVLFVDADPQVLEGLQELLRPYRKRWRMEFTQGAQAALAEMEREPADVVVSDLRMPWIGGASLLQLLAAWYPGTRRIILTRQPERVSSERVSRFAHAVLPKPCDTDALAAAVDGSHQD